MQVVLGIGNSRFVIDQHPNRWRIKIIKLAITNGLNAKASRSRSPQSQPAGRFSEGSRLVVCIFSRHEVKSRGSQFTGRHQRRCDQRSDSLAHRRSGRYQVIPDPNRGVAEEGACFPPRTEINATTPVSFSLSMTAAAAFPTLAAANAVSWTPSSTIKMGASLELDWTAADSSSNGRLPIVSCGLIASTSSTWDTAAGW